MSQDRSISIRRTLGEALSEHDINELGRTTGQSKRLRVVTPFRLVSALLVALGTGATETIADLRREFNFQHDNCVQAVLPPAGASGVCEVHARRSHPPHGTARNARPEAGAGQPASPMSSFKMARRLR